MSDREKLKPLDWTNDLKKIDRLYLKEQKISEREFKVMNPVAQMEWKEECHDLAYENIRKLR